MKTFTPTTGIVRPGEYFVCNCGVPLVKCVAFGKYEMMKKESGQVVKVTTETKDGIINIKCQKCSRGMAYINIQESMTVT